MTTSIKQSIIKQPFVWLTLAFLVRLYFVFQPGHQLDLTTFSIWGYHLNHLPGNLFFKQVWSDYLPLPLLYTKLISWLASFLHLSFAFVWKLSLTILEIILLFFISGFTPFKNSKFALFLLYFSPALIINGAWWGQLDALVSLLLLLNFLAVKHRRFWLSLLTFSLAFSLKPLVILCLPFLLLFWALRYSFKSSFYFLGLFIFLILLPATYFLSSFNFKSLVIFFSHRLFFQASVYSFTTINAFNFWSLFGHFWTPDNQPILGLTAHFFGLFIFSLIYLSLFKLYFSKPRHFLTLVKVSILSLLAFYAFGTRMHERHLLYALPLLLLVNSALTRFSFLVLNLIFSFNNLASLYWLHHQVWPLSPTWTHLFSLSLVLIFLGLYLHFWGFKLSDFKSFFARYKLPFFIFCLAFGLRLIHLNYPQTMIFDEVYHAFTAREFVRGDNLVAWEWWHQAPQGYAYEWTHPPLAKYGMVVGMLLFGQNSFGWRFGSALFGALSLVLVYFLSLHWFRSSKIAFLAAFLLAFDGLHLVQSRIAMNDIYMLFFSLLSLLLASRRRWSLAAFNLGLALASKWSALYLTLPLAYLFFHQHRRLNLANGLAILRYAIIVVLTYFLTYTPFFLHHSWSQFLELQKQMWLYHTHLKATHPYQSKPWQWIFGLRPVWYYTHHVSSRLANIYAQSNPLLLSLSFLAIIFYLPFYWQASLLVPTLAYFSFWLPWLFSPRIMFFYHYLPSLTFLYILIAYLLSKLPQSLLRLFFIAWGLTFIILVLPSVYGIPLPFSYWRFLFKLFPSWK